MELVGVEFNVDKCEDLETLRNLVRSVKVQLDQKNVIFGAPAGRSAVDTWLAVQAGCRPLDIKDIPEELIVILLQYLDFTTRQRLRRVCRKWKVLLSLPEVAQRIHLDTASLMNNGRLVLELLTGCCFYEYGDDSEAQHDRLPAICEITFNGQYSRLPDFEFRFSEMLVQLTRWCPNLIILRLYNLHMGKAYDTWDIEEEKAYQLSVTSSVVTFAILSLPTAGLKHKLVSVPLTCKVPNVLVAVGENFKDIMEGRLMVPQYREQLAWLMKCAGLMRDDKRWLAWLKKPKQSGLNIGSRKRNRLFRSGKLDKLEDEPLKKLLPHMKLLNLAAYVLSRADLPLPRAPFKFCFESDEFYRLLVLGQL